MKVLILNGSPRKIGKLSQILHCIESNAKQKNEVLFFNVNELEFKSCVGCMACRKTNVCSLPKDDASMIAKNIKKCDAIVVGTPVYWANMNGDLKRLFDRLAGVLMSETKLGIPKPLLKGKKAYIVVTCTTPFPFNIFAGQSTKASGAIKEVLVTAGFKIKGKFVLAGTKGMSEISQRNVRKINRIF